MPRREEFEIARRKGKKKSHNHEAAEHSIRAVGPQEGEKGQRHFTQESSIQLGEKRGGRIGSDALAEKGGKRTAAATAA